MKQKRKKYTTTLTNEAIKDLEYLTIKLNMRYNNDVIEKLLKDERMRQNEMDKTKN